jgi:hypothetical protein
MLCNNDVATALTTRTRQQYWQVYVITLLDVRMPSGGLTLYDGQGLRNVDWAADSLQQGNTIAVSPLGVFLWRVTLANRGLSLHGLVPVKPFSSEK